MHTATASAWNTAVEISKRAHTMSWWGKLVGGTFGFMLGGPLGALFGAAVGHGFDRGLGQLELGVDPSAAGSTQERTQAAFFTATFSVMGHVAKVDGKVTADEIALARAVMMQMALSEAQMRFAQDLFSRGKQADFDLDGVLAQFRQECHRRQTLLQMFLEIQLHAAYADGALDARERALLTHLASQLGFSAAHLAQLEALVRAQRQPGQNHRDSGRDHARNPAQPAGLSLSDAYRALGVPAAASDAEVKKAYRRLMNQHHPDKLVSKGLPEEMMKMATMRTQEIKAAYERVKAARSSTSGA